MTKNDIMKHFGSQRAIADLLNIDQSAVSLWGDTVPLQRQAQLQILSNGKLTAELPTPRKLHLYEL
jgi:hypothetical protein